MLQNRTDTSAATLDFLAITGPFQFPFQDKWVKNTPTIPSFPPIFSVFLRKQTTLASASFILKNEVKKGEFGCAE